eukprot:TRINITY_DN19318_c0_g2_i1.p2 TRINITY_DN19318_c0_g2~~TRINITY_DN19318_c0_g2_i1.p2  ORF type:complete len:277 (+),score=-4.94 TRINITY_DN19318_c0_g2_i1:516-1346(+)
MAMGSYVLQFINFKHQLSISQKTQILSNFNVLPKILVFFCTVNRERLDKFLKCALKVIRIDFFFLVKYFFKDICILLKKIKIQRRKIQKTCPPIVCVKEICAKYQFLSSCSIQKCSPKMFANSQKKLSSSFNCFETHLDISECGTTFHSFILNLSQKTKISALFSKENFVFDKFNISNLQYIKIQVLCVVENLFNLIIFLISNLQNIHCGCVILLLLLLLALRCLAFALYQQFIDVEEFQANFVVVYFVSALYQIFCLYGFRCYMFLVVNKIPIQM